MANSHLPKIGGKLPRMQRSQLQQTSTSIIPRSLFGNKQLAATETVSLWKNFRLKGKNMMLEREIQQETFIHGSSTIRSDKSKLPTLCRWSKQQLKKKCSNRHFRNRGAKTRVEREANSPNIGEQYKQHRRHPGKKQACGRQC